MSGRAAVALAVVVALAGCSVPIARLTAAAREPTVDARLVSHGRWDGSTCRWWILGVPLQLPQIDDAIADALARGNGVLMKDVDVFSEHTFWLLAGTHCYRVHGEVFGPAGEAT